MYSRRFLPKTYRSHVEMSLNPDHFEPVRLEFHAGKLFIGQDIRGVFFQYLPDKSKRGIINQIIAHEEGIAMASEVLMTISKDEIERARLRSEEKFVLDTQSKLVHAKREGKQEIINLLKSGKSPEEIIREYGTQDVPQR
jgi:hypothetical protein